MRVRHRSWLEAAAPGSEVVVEIRGPGQVVGEVVMEDPPPPCRCSSRARGEVVALKLTQENYLRALAAMYLEAESGARASASSCGAAPGGGGGGGGGGGASAAACTGAVAGAGAAPGGLSPVMSGAHAAGHGGGSRLVSEAGAPQIWGTAVGPDPVAAQLREAARAAAEQAVSGDETVESGDDTLESNTQPAAPI
jgi:hypothetical protein